METARFVQLLPTTICIKIKNPQLRREEMQLGVPHDAERANGSFH